MLLDAIVTSWRVTRDELAALLHADDSTLRRWVRESPLPRRLLLRLAQYAGRDVVRRARLDSDAEWAAFVAEAGGRRAPPPPSLADLWKFGRSGGDVKQRGTWAGATVRDGAGG